VVWRGINLIQRPPGAAPESADGWRLWLGATLEPGQEADERALESLRELGGDAPEWLRRARACRRWQGLRARPVGQPAPLLQDRGAGLLLATGHYRNGVLLAPASAEWVAARIEAGRGAT
jgi:glycine/D-amino acid oxidase-like deaminating enzyme